MLHSTCSLLPVLVHLGSRSSRKKSAPFAADIKAFALLAQCTKCAEVMEVVVAGAAAIKKKPSGDVRRKEGTRGGEIT